MKFLILGLSLAPMSVIPENQLLVLFSCIAALLGADVILTDLPDRLRLLKKNVEVNVDEGNARGSARVSELTWGDELDPEFIEPSMPEFGKLVTFPDLLHLFLCRALAADLKLKFISPTF